MTAAGPIRRFLSAARLWRAPQPLRGRFDGQLARQLLKVASQEAFLSTQPNAERALLAQRNGDTH